MPKQQENQPQKDTTDQTGEKSDDLDIFAVEKYNPLRIFLRRIRQKVTNTLRGLTAKRLKETDYTKEQDVVPPPLPPPPLNIEALRQSYDIGDCHMISVFYAISHHPMAEAFLRKIVQPHRGSQNVFFPGAKLGEPGYKTDPLTIHDNELPGQVHEHRDPAKKPTVLRPVNADREWIALERAMGRRRKIMDKAQQAEERAKMETGQGHNETSAADYSLAIIGLGDHPSVNLNLLLGDIADIEPLSLGMSSFEEKEQEKLVVESKDIEKLEVFLAEKALEKNRYIAIASTYHRRNKDDKTPLDEKNRFLPRHAYTVTSVDIKKGTITVTNPHDTTSEEKTHEISFKEFLKYFGKISYAVLDPEKTRASYGESALPEEPAPKPSSFSWNLPIDIPFEYVLNSHPIEVRLPRKNSIIIYPSKATWAEPEIKLKANGGRERATFGETSMTQSKYIGPLDFDRKDDRERHIEEPDLAEGFTKKVRIRQLGHNRIAITALDKKTPITVHIA